jgi:hypothetical protein
MLLPTHEGGLRGAGGQDRSFEGAREKVRVAKRK